MNCSEIPKGWEKCEIATGCTLLLANGLEVRYCDSESTRSWCWGHSGAIEMRLPSQSHSFMVTLPHVDALTNLSITPIRKVKEEPIEFTGKGVLLDGTVIIGKTFREVIE